ncbi:hypothetical protein EPI10_003559 [Gossypium australe]|uniref:RNase H type-1 domain-containing protein n=1 Tax=Gossypium australe TaxID=47621 RepID=A0A5B6UIV0_9ROSI|nr:hypothetical protein EPI10_003559 [Gossypium australe]
MLMKLSMWHTVGQGNMSFLIGAHRLRHKLKLLKRIHQLLTRIGHWRIRHFSREDNQDADRLVKLAQHRTYDLCLYEVSSLKRTLLLAGMVNGGMQAKYNSLHQQMKGVNEKIQMTSSRKLLMGAMLDYEETGANTKHEPRKRPGKP